MRTSEKRKIKDEENRMIDTDSNVLTSLHILFNCNCCTFVCLLVC